jgi:hypothetical protein
VAFPVNNTTGTPGSFSGSGNIGSQPHYTFKSVNYGRIHWFKVIAGNCGAAPCDPDYNESGYSNVASGVYARDVFGFDDTGDYGKDGDVTAMKSIDSNCSTDVGGYRYCRVDGTLHANEDCDHYSFTIHGNGKVYLALRSLTAKDARMEFWQNNFAIWSLVKSVNSVGQGEWEYYEADVGGLPTGSVFAVKVFSTVSNSPVGDYQLHVVVPK